MRVRELLDAWVWTNCGDTRIGIDTVDNPYGDDFEWVGGFRDVANSGFANAVVIDFNVGRLDGVHAIAIRVNAHTVPVGVLRRDN